MRRIPHTTLVHGLVLAAVWAVVSLFAASAFFFEAERRVVLASHDALVRPTLDGRVTVRTGPLLPDIRLGSGHDLGVEITLGKTTAATTAELAQRYALIASQPEGSIAQVERAVRGMALDSALRGGMVGLVPVASWLLLGGPRRKELLDMARSRRGVAVGTALVVAAVLLWEPWGEDPVAVEDQQTWLTLQQFVGRDALVPAVAAEVEIRSDPSALDTRRLVTSAISTYEKSLGFYDQAAARAADLEVREPGEDETVALLVSDRHDNIGMDRVARAIGDRAGATVVLDAGDDTSTGSSWEAFSLDSLAAAFADDYERYAVLGNHDHGDFVADYLADLDWNVLDEEVVDVDGMGRLAGIPDPRSSGLGSWRDETGLAFGEVAALFSESLCNAEERVTTVLVHDTDLARGAIEQGCVDLVLGGHVHVKVGPDRVEAPDGRVAYEYTTGTTGGAAYAIAIGSKPRRDAMVSLVTYRDERPVGIQTVTLQTNGSFLVGPFEELDLGGVDGSTDEPPADADDDADDGADARR